MIKLSKEQIAKCKYADLLVWDSLSFWSFNKPTGLLKDGIPFWEHCNEFYIKWASTLCTEYPKYNLYYTIYKLSSRY